ncbi:ribosomal protection-like ABC-F family protein [Chordicoccus furentiruminis]|uniref:ribosomal protection-like ABC-F family protein n=1 Tax=Chordicoccus furentiruminis TaxID=2709410 RepID=UPI0023A8CD9B|nr:ABC-F family ATP-binding cassette domain-containing protein [Chordicoccus furentiruminis]
MILNIAEVTKAFDGKEILKGVSFHVEANEKAALVGVNGAGKSTLLKIIMGEETADSGQTVLAKDARIGYLAQHQALTGDETILNQLMSVRQDLLDLADSIRESELQMTRLSGDILEEEMKRYARMTEAFERGGGYAYRSEVVGVLKGLGFSESDFTKTAGELSGGQKTRVALGRLLLTAPDIILLDEPTNHLDMHSIEWLETYLMNYRGAVLIVSHDRYFLNRVVTKVVEIENGHARTYSGNYDAFSEKKEMLRKAAYAAWVNAERERKHQEEVITRLKSFNREKSIRRAESREKMLAKMESPEKPADADDEMTLRFTPRLESGRDVLTVDGLTKRFDGVTLFSGLHFEIRRGEHVALIGNNGTGKSTILKILNGVIPPDDGTVAYGSQVEVSYYDQEMQVLDSSKTIFDEISDDYPAMTNTEIRTKLAAFLFTGEDVFKRIGSLSGGERARVSLCKLMLSDANFIMLDEPTNHLDITSREVLESAIRAYDGTVLCVSHDRYFINRTATRILDLTEHQLLNYIGNYDYYLEKKADVERAALGDTESGTETETGESRAKLDWKARKEEEARKRKLASSLRRTEEEIENLEREDAELDKAFEDPAVATDHEKLTELSRRKEAIASDLSAAYERWEKLQSEADAEDA